MPDKKYDFCKILSEYNKKCSIKYTIDSDIKAPIIIHRNGGEFKVKCNTETCHDVIFSLDKFLFCHVNPSFSLTVMKDFIRSKENSKLDIEIKILPPNKIRYAYLHTNYFSKEGSLGNSCMRQREMQKALNFYVKNNVRIVVAIDNNNKIHARALLWDNINSTQLKKPVTYLDRVYSRSDSLHQLFYDLATENKWKCYGHTSAGKATGYYYITSVNLKDICHLPYTDTFRYLYYKDNIIVSGTLPVVMKMIKHNISVSLTSTHSGGYFPQLDANRVQEALTGNYISKKDAVLVKRYSAYILKNNIADINGDYYSVHDNKITKSPLDGFILRENSVDEIFTNTKIDKTKAVYFPKHNGYIHKDNIICIKGDIFHKGDKDTIYFDKKWYHISDCFINYDREKANAELARQKCQFCVSDEVFIPSPKSSSIRKEGLIPKERAIIAYNLIYNPIINDIEYQEVYIPDTYSKDNYIVIADGTFIINSSENKQYLKKFNNKYYIRRAFHGPNKNQLLLFGDKK